MKTEIEKQLQQLAQQAFESHNFNFQPLFPNILIRIFDFEDATSGLIIKPDVAQAPNHRAIVIRTWQPKEYIGRDGVKRDIHSEFEPGDIITVPFWSGVPTGVENLDDAGYRVTQENARRTSDGNYIRLGATQETQHIFYKCGMFDKRAAVKSVIETIYNNIEYLPLNGADDNPEKDIAITIEKILADYDIVPKRLSLV